MVNSRQGKELFTLADNAGTRTNGCNLAMNKFRLEARKILAVKLWGSRVVYQYKLWVQKKKTPQLKIFNDEDCWVHGKCQKHGSLDK